ncbi:hypothetical protein ACFL0A_00640 [Patescibacteria group bacterium]
MEEIEEEILEKAGIFKKARTAFEKAKRDLEREVVDYQDKRERLQREAWEKENLGWCQKCDKFHPKESIRLLYTEGLYRDYTPYKRLQSFCKQCAELLLSCPRGDTDKFQCYKAKEEKEGFVIFVSGKWIPIPELEHTTIKIEREYISEEDYQFGKNIQLDDRLNLSLKIGGKEIL